MLQCGVIVRPKTVSCPESADADIWYESIPIAKSWSRSGCATRSGRVTGIAISHWVPSRLGITESGSGSETARGIQYCSTIRLKRR